MGKRGPAPTSSTSRGRAPVEAPELVELDPPDYLDLDAVAVWHRLAPTLAERGVLTEWDVDTFAVFCTTVVHHKRAAVVVNERGILVKQRSSYVKNPALQIVRDTAAQLAQYAARFGLTPADRARLQVAEAELDLEDDDLELDW